MQEFKELGKSLLLESDTISSVFGDKIDSYFDLYRAGGSSSINGLGVKLVELRDGTPVVLSAERHEPMFEWFSIKAHRPKDGKIKKIGKAFLKPIDENYLKGDADLSSLHVEEKFRGKGLAFLMYDFAEEVSDRTIIPSGNLTKGGYEFWKKRIRKKNLDINLDDLLNKS